MADDPNDLIDLLRSTPTIVRGLYRNIDDEQARVAAIAGEWSPVEIVAHLADAEERAIERVDRMLVTDEPVLLGYDQEELALRRGYLQMSFRKQLDRFEQLRGERIAVLSGLSADQWKRTGNHNEAGMMTIQELTMWMVTHDNVHLVQIAKSLLV